MDASAPITDADDSALFEDAEAAERAAARARQMAAEAELLQQIFSNKFAEEYKTPHPMLNTPKT